MRKRVVFFGTTGSRFVAIHFIDLKHKGRIYRLTLCDMRPLFFESVKWIATRQEAKRLTTCS